MGLYRQDSKWFPSQFGVYRRFRREKKAIFGFGISCLTHAFVFLLLGWVSLDCPCINMVLICYSSDLGNQVRKLVDKGIPKAKFLGSFISPWRLSWMLFSEHRAKYLIILSFWNLSTCWLSRKKILLVMDTVINLQVIFSICMYFLCF